MAQRIIWWWWWLPAIPKGQSTTVSYEGIVFFQSRPSINGQRYDNGSSNFTCSINMLPMFHHNNKPNHKNEDKGDDEAGGVGRRSKVCKVHDSLPPHVRNQKG
jgi:hypothetical protein